MRWKPSMRCALAVSIGTLLNLSCTNELRVRPDTGGAENDPARQGGDDAPTDGGGAEAGSGSKTGSGDKPLTSEERLLNPAKWLCCKYPFLTSPQLDFNTGYRNFGAPRDGARKHAGVDLTYDRGTTMYAIGDGVVLDFYEFYKGTWALEVKHRDFIARYGEVSPSGPKFKPGFYTRQWQRLAFVGSIEMLHLELYSGKATGPLTNRENVPFERRSDLMDPTNYVKSWMDSTLSGR